VPRTGAAIDLYWIPLGAGGHCVRFNGRVFEALVARREHRARHDLFHTALVVHLEGRRHVIEMAPVWNAPDPARSVACTGPVGLRWLGQFRWFRYEVRAWPDGVIPDIGEAVDSPQRLSTDPAAAARLLAALSAFPPATWGRDEQRAGEMWNSNSLVSWALDRAGLDAGDLAPPSDGRAPGWSAGLVVAARDRQAPS
jgi:hypothetical protein